MNLYEQLASLTTEAVNPRTVGIDILPTDNIVQLLHQEDQLIDNAVGFVLPEVIKAVDLLVGTLNAGKRMLYVGAGTSGRLGILDAAEMPPTYGVDPNLVAAIIAGGSAAVFTSVEGVEDDEKEGAMALRGAAAMDDRRIGLVIGISASGRTPFVLGALKEAYKQNMSTVIISTNEEPIVRAFAPSVDLYICPQVGPEPIAGSTRMKSGTAQKMIVNMITTAAMVRLGKTFGNVMVDLKATNEKLRARSIKTVHVLANVGIAESEQLLREVDWNVKIALLMARKHCTRGEAEALLDAVKGRVRLALEEA